MRDLQEFLDILGELHDVKLTAVAWSPDDGVLRLHLEDIFANYEGLPEYPGCVSGALIVRNPATLMLDFPETVEGLRIYAAHAELVGDNRKLEFNISPTGKLVVTGGVVELPDIPPLPR